MKVNMRFFNVFSSHTASAARTIAALSALAFVTSSLHAANPLQATITDFESGSTHAAVPISAANSAATGASNTAIANVLESGSRRLQLTDADGSFNGAVVTFPGAIPQAGYYLFSADVKVDNASSPIGTFGMGATIGAPTTTKISDVNAGYVLNLTGTGDAALGYQTIGAAIEVPAGGTFPKDLTLYFGTDPSGNNYNASAFDGNYNGNHRAGTTTWAAGSANAVYIDNIKRVGPGNFGEERHLWISLGDSYGNLASLEQKLVAAKNNNFNCVDILARYRADAYYIPNRNNTTYPNPEPLGSVASGRATSESNDPIQYAIDRGHELGLKVYVSFGTFLVSDSNTYPAFLPSGSQMWYYNGGAPRAMLAGDPSAEGVWADPGRADVRNYTLNVLKDFVSNYDVDGVIFDRIRYPSSQYSYNPQSLSELGVVGTPSPTDPAFRDKRRDAVTRFLGDAYDQVTAIKPWMVIGTAPIAYAAALTDTYNSVFQFFPKWSARKTNNRAISFGCCDLYQPQFYRLWNSTGFEAPASNTTLMNKAQFGDVASFSMDYGLMPGAYSAVAPLFFHPNSGDVNQSNANAQNITDSRALSMNGWGLWRAVQSLADIAHIRAPGASTAGVDVLGAPSAPNDYLFKEDYDNVKPNTPGSFSATPNADGTIRLAWSAPLAAADGEGATRYVIYKSTTSPVKEYYANEVTHSNISGATTSYVVPTDYAGTYYFKIVAIDDYNNRSVAAQAGPVTAPGEPLPPADVIVDNPAATLTGTWSVASAAADKYGADYRYKGVGTGAATATFSATIPQSGTWAVHEWHSVGGNRATNARHSITHNGGSTVATANQTVNGGKWNKLGEFAFTGSSSYSTTIDDLFSGTVVMADAIRWEYIVQAPAAPSGLAATSPSQTSVNLTWTDNASNERNYIVARSTASGGPYADIAALGINVTSYTDTGRTANTTYYYVVRAQNSGGTSSNSNQAVVTTLPNPPAAPSGLTASAVSTSQINLSWTDNSTNEGNFVVARSTASGGPFTDITSLPAGTTSYSNTGLSASTTYYYRVRATNTGGASANSNTASATTASALPAAPSGLTATAAGSSQINLAWVDNASNESNYVVARSTTTGGPYTNIATLGANVVSYSNTGLAANTTYYYVVRATNASGASANSNQASASTSGVDIIVDNTSAAFAGTWSTGSAATNKYGADYRYATSGSGGTATYNANVPTAGNYRVQVWYSNGTNRSNNAPHSVNFSGGSLIYNVNQQINGGVWVTLGTHYFTAGGGQVIISTVGANPTIVMADAVRFTYLNSTAPVTLSFNSITTEDGWVLESTETSNVGGLTNNVNAVVTAGDQNAKRQYKGMMSFDTASIPDGATIQKVTLKLTRYSINGGDPWVSLGALQVHVKSPHFGTATTIENVDFENAPGASNVATVPKPSANNVTVSAPFSNLGVFTTNKTGRTQVRIEFTKDDDNDTTNDYANFHSGESATQAYRPKLEIQYTQ